MNHGLPETTAFSSTDDELNKAVTGLMVTQAVMSIELAPILKDIADKLEWAEFVGAFPIRQDITVIPADPPDKKLLGWIFREGKNGETYLEKPS